MQPVSFGSPSSITVNQAENARFMSRVYGWMTAGLTVSAAVAWYIGQNDELAKSIIMNRGLFWVLIIAQFGAVIALSALIQKMGTFTAMAIYLVYAALTGVTLSSIFLIYTQASIMQIFGLTAFSFAGLSGFGYVTKRDLGPVGSFCVMGLFGLVGIALVSIFVPSLMTGYAGYAYSLIGIAIFAGLTAYDTQKIKAMASDGADGDAKGAVYGALILYLDFINLFLLLLRLLGGKRD